MLQTPDGYATEDINKLSWEVEKQYVIQPNDLLEIEVFSNNGERIIDPDMELANDIGLTQGVNKPEISYQVSKDGLIKLPMVGDVNLSNMNLRTAESELEAKYKEFYATPFVQIRFLNKRVTVVGEANMVIPLANENTHLIEVLALADAVTNNSKMQNIRVVRGENVFVIDLSRIEGLKQANLSMQPGDIVYVEPVRRPFVESFRDYAPVIGVFTSIAVVISILTR
jgi:polysaccharide export outer membrane protein